MPRPLKLDTAVASPRYDSKPVKITSYLVDTGLQPDGSSVPRSEYRLSDNIASLMRHPGSPGYILDDGPSLRLDKVPTGTLDALIAAERNAPGAFPNDSNYNSAWVSVEGVLRLGEGAHGSSLDVSKITAAPPPVY